MTADIAKNPIVAIDWPRADFRLAALEFLIGLLAAACPPETESAWVSWWREPPDPTTLQAAFEPLAHAFALDGDGPRFMQDFDDLPGEPTLPESLLIEAPGDAGRRNNTTLLVKPDRVQRLSRPAAAMALFTLQTYAPAGGRGNLTSLRGGGPLTTLVIPGPDAPGRPLPLWHLLWANVPRGRKPPPDALPRVFPWLAPTRTADRFPATIPDEDADSLQAFWGMPRRIRLEFALNPARLPCDLTGAVDDVIVTGWRQRPNGVRYAQWQHPLSPMYRDGKGGGWLPVHPQPGGIGYRHWVGLAIDNGAGSNTRKRAACIATWHEERRRRIDRSAGDGARLLAAGYDMDNMKARAFVESEMPLPGSDDAAAERAIARRAESLVKAADEAARALRLAIRDARYDDDTAVDAGPIAAAYEAFWSATQDGFFIRLREAADLALAEPDEAREIAAARSWCDLLRRAALDLFDEAAPLDPGAASFDPARIVRARARLFWMFLGRNAAGKRLFEALGLPDPEPAKPQPVRRARSKETA